MKRIVLFLFCALALQSCSMLGYVPNEHVRQRKAQKKLRKAMRIYPDIVKLQHTDTVIRGEASGPVTIEVPGFSVSGDPVNADSLIGRIQQLQRNLYSAQDEKGSLYLYSDSLLDVLVKKNSDGKLQIKANVKERRIIDTVKVPYEVTVQVPGKVFKQIVENKAPAYRYWWFWVLLLMSVLFGYLYVTQIMNRKGGISINLTKEGQNDRTINGEH